MGTNAQLVRGDTLIMSYLGHETSSANKSITNPSLSSNTVAHPWLFCHQAQPTLALVACWPFTKNCGLGGPYAVNVTVEAKPVRT